MSHTEFRNDKLFCTHCGGEYKIKYPLPGLEFTKKIEAFDSLQEKIEAFDSLHADCLPVWKEPEVDQSQAAKEKAMWWIANGRVGLSSKTMWECLMGQNPSRAYYPHDPDDFSRCYKLLQAVPEWKNELNKLKPLSRQWTNLVDHWDKLTEMYEQNVKEEWKNAERIGMYKFMETLVK